MDGPVYLMFAVAILAALILGLLTGHWEPCIGLSICVAFLAALDVIWPD
jgi:hypothetical protein